MLSFSFQPFPELQTDRLVLRCFTEADAPALFPFRSDPRVMQYIPRKRAETVQDMVDLVNLMNTTCAKNDGITWAITSKQSGELLGSIGFVQLHPHAHRAEVGYLLGAPAQGKGIATEALAAILRYGFGQMGLNSVEAVIHPENNASQKLVERCGFTRAGYFRDFNELDGIFIDAVIYELLARDPQPRF